MEILKNNLFPPIKLRLFHYFSKNSSFKLVYSKNFRYVMKLFTTAISQCHRSNEFFKIMTVFFRFSA